MPIRLEVFLNSFEQNATGVLYLDDGETFEYEKGEKILINYYY